MADDINKSILVGRLTADSKLSYTKSNYPILNFSIASNRSVKVNGNWEEKTSFINVRLWGKRGESLANYLKKGQMVGIDGKLIQDRYEKDGQKVSLVFVEADNVQLLGGKKGQSNNNQSEYTPANDSFEDDVPF